MCNKKIIFLFLTTFFFTTSCKVERTTMVGVWKPSVLILPPVMQTAEKVQQAKMITQTFEQSKDMLYHFHADSTFTLESLKGESGFQDAAGKYSVVGNTVAISIYNTILKSDIVKLTEKEMYVKSTDSVTIIYERIRDN